MEGFQFPILADDNWKLIGVSQEALQVLQQADEKDRAEFFVMLSAATRHGIGKSFIFDDEGHALPFEEVIHPLSPRSSRGKIQTSGRRRMCWKKKAKQYRAIFWVNVDERKLYLHGLYLDHDSCQVAMTQIRQGIQVQSKKTKCVPLANVDIISPKDDFDKDKPEKEKWEKRDAQPIFTVQLLTDTKFALNN